MLKGPGLLHDIQSDEDCEYLVAVKWIKHVPRDEAKFRRKAGLFTYPSIVASLSGQLKTLQFLEAEFNVNIEKLLSVE
jgi:hypothetical protein